MTTLNLQDTKHIHFVGIKGVGMTSLALCALDLQIKVTGSDIVETFVTDETLKKYGIKWNIGFSEKNLAPKPDLVITTGAHGGFTNPEVVAAKKLGVKVMSHAEALAWLAKEKDIIAVCGVGGKSTTSAMVATILETSGRYPSFAIGVGNISAFGTPGKFNKKGSEFVCEADEFVISPGNDNRPRFSLLSPKITVVTNIEHDHPDFYPTIDDTKKVFRTFFQKVSSGGLLVAHIDNRNVKNIIQGLTAPVTTYGMSPQADWQIKNLRFKEQKTFYSIKAKDGHIVNVVLRVPGEFNALNATAAFVVGRHLGIPENKLVAGIYAYDGCRRRFEKIGEKNGILIYDDYAHHPIEIKATLKAARQWFPRRRIIAVFQPHTYSRTKALLADFAKSFSDADIVVFMDIYASTRETDTLGVSSRLLSQETAKHHKNVHYTGNHKNTVQFLAESAQKGDIILTMGAGNIFYIHDELLRTLAIRN